MPTFAHQLRNNAKGSIRGKPVHTVEGISDGGKLYIPQWGGLRGPAIAQ